MSVEVFDEAIALRRFEVALKRDDWRMFGDAVARLGEELAQGSRFAREPEWRELVRKADTHEGLPGELMHGLRAMVARVLEVDARDLREGVAPAAEGPAIVVVDLWRSSLADPARLAAFQAWLAQPGASSAAAGRVRLASWLESGLSLASIAARAQLALAADAAGLAAGEPAWVEVYFAGLRATQNAAPVPSLADALAGHGAVVITGEAGQMDPDDQAGLVLSLGGSLNWFYCQACRDTSTTPGAIVAACAHCGGPAHPLVVPPGSSDFQPPPLRRAWDQAADALRAAKTWLLIAPPDPSDPLAAWVLDRLPEDRQVFLVGNDGAHRAWRTRLAATGAVVVTSPGPAEDVLKGLLAGGSATPEPARGEPRAGLVAKKKKR